MSLLDGAYALIAPTGRSIGTIVPDCTFEEHHSDRLTITEHPVETGASITDHAFRNPSEVSMKIGFSNSTARTEGWVQQAYQLLLSLQQQRQPFSVSTGKRQYQNMLIAGLEVVTDPSSEFALMCTADLREVIIVSTQQSSGGGSANATSPADDPVDQAMPQSTYAVDNQGNVVLGSDTSGSATFAQTQTSQSGSSDFATISGGNGYSSGFTTSADGGFATDTPYGATGVGDGSGTSATSVGGGSPTTEEEGAPIDLGTITVTQAPQLAQ